MPGSPPIRTIEPGTMPPPSTRSNSPMPEGMRGVSDASTTSYGLGRPPASLSSDGARPLLAAVGTSCRSSTKLFHSPQSGHRPSHLLLSNPHAWQPKTVLNFGDEAMAASMRSGPDKRGLDGGDPPGLDVDPGHTRPDPRHDFPGVGARPVRNFPGSRLVADQDGLVALRDLRPVRQVQHRQVHAHRPAHGHAVAAHDELAVVAHGVRAGHAVRVSDGNASYARGPWRHPAAAVGDARPFRDVLDERDIRADRHDRPHVHVRRERTRADPVEKEAG